MAIWFQEYNLEGVVQKHRGTILEQLGIEIISLDESSISGKMPVDHRTIQPAGILHGGASVVLAESLGSLGSNLIIDPKKFMAVGLDVNANHIRQVTKGFVYGTATPIHIGFSTHVWHIEIKNELKKLTCVSRLTMAIIKNTGSN